MNDGNFQFGLTAYIISGRPLFKKILCDVKGKMCSKCGEDWSKIVLTILSTDGRTDRRTRQAIITSLTFTISYGE